MPVIGAYHCLTSQPIVGSYTHRYTTFGMASNSRPLSSDLQKLLAHPILTPCVGYLEYLFSRKSLYLCTFWSGRLKRQTGHIRSRVGLRIGTGHEANRGPAVDGGAGFPVSPRQW